MKTQLFFIVMVSLSFASKTLATATMAYDSKVSNMSGLNHRLKSSLPLSGFSNPAIRKKAQVLFGNLEKMGLNQSALSTMASQTVQVVPFNQLGQAGCVLPQDLVGKINPHTGDRFRVSGCVANGQIIIPSSSASGAFGVVIHELAHTIDHYPPRYQLEQLGCAHRINLYVKKLCNPKNRDPNCGREIFAETFTAFVGNPGRLKSVCPQAYQLMKTHLFNQ